MLSKVGHGILRRGFWWHIKKEKTFVNKSAFSARLHCRHFKQVMQTERSAYLLLRTSVWHSDLKPQPEPRFWFLKMRTDSSSIKPIKLSPVS